MSDPTSAKHAAIVQHWPWEVDVGLRATQRPHVVEGVGVVLVAVGRNPGVGREHEQGHDASEQYAREPGYIHNVFSLYIEPNNMDRHCCRRAHARYADHRPPSRFINT